MPPKKRTPKESNNNRFSPSPINTLETCILSDNHMHQNNNKTLHIPEFFTDSHNSTISWLNLVSQMGKLKDADEKSICAAVLNKLPSKILKEISQDLERIFDKQNPCTLLKQTILDTSEINNSKIFENRFKNSTLGDQKSSTFLKSLEKNLDLIKEDLKQYLFCRALSGNVRAILATTKTNNTKEMAVIADSIHREFQSNNKTDQFENNIFNINKEVIKEE